MLSRDYNMVVQNRLEMELLITALNRASASVTRSKNHASMEVLIAYLGVVEEKVCLASLGPVSLGPVFLSIDAIRAVEKDIYSDTSPLYPGAMTAGPANN